MKFHLYILSLAVFHCIIPLHAELLLAERGKSEFSVLCDAVINTPERNAANDLASTLEQITTAKFVVQKPDPNVPVRAILVGASGSSLVSVAD